MSKVLVVDDERNIRLTLTRTLESAGLEITTAVNGEEALALMERQEFDLVLLDLRLPGMPGTEVLARLRERHPGLPVVMITAHGTIDIAVEAMRAGAADFIRKPFTPDEVREVVSRALAGAPPDGNELLRRARAAIRRHELGKADALLKRALAVCGDRADVHNLRGAVTELGGDWLDAQKQYRAALDFDPVYSPARRNLERTASWNKGGAVDLGDGEPGPDARG